MTDWPTKEYDLHIAREIIENYASEYKTEGLELFELVVDEKAKRMNYQLASWVHHLAQYFKSTYGEAQGDFITGQIICQWLTFGQTKH